MKTKNRHNSHPRFGVYNSWFRGDYQFELFTGIEYEAKRNDVQVFYFKGRSPHCPFPYENNYNITNIYKKVGVSKRYDLLSIL